MLNEKGTLHYIADDRDNERVDDLSDYIADGIKAVQRRLQAEALMDAIDRMQEATS